VHIFSNTPNIFWFIFLKQQAIAAETLYGKGFQLNKNFF